MNRGLGAIAVMVASMAVAQAPAPDMAPGREVVRLALAADAAALSRRTTPAFLAAVGGEAGFATFLGRITSQLGAEQAVLEEVAFNEGGLTSYYRRSRFEKAPDVTSYWITDRQGVIHAGSVRPTAAPAASTRLGYRPHTQLRLPFAAPAQGRWYVAWGGRDAIHNYHVRATDQRFAADLLVMQDASPSRGDGKANADFYCWGTPVLAPAAARVVTVVDGIADNAAPGVRNDSAPAGNHVILDFGQGEYGVLAHLRQGSVAVRPGQRVAAGARLGVCGNSGRSTMPHLHFHLQDQPVFGQGAGLPLIFAREGEVVRGQYLTP